MFSIVYISSTKILTKVVNKEIDGSEPKYQNAYPTPVEYKVSFKVPSKYNGDEDKI